MPHEHRSPQDRPGTRPPRDRRAAPTPHTAHDPRARQLLELQRHAGNDAVQRLVAGGAPPVGAVAVQREVVTIGGEKVDVADDTEKAEAQAILTRLEESFDVALNSQYTIQGIKDQYTNVKDEVKATLKARTWRMVELRALEQALGYYAPILGAERASSTRAGTGQEVTSVGKVDQAIDANIPAGKLDTTTLGEFFRAKKNMGLFKASEGFKADFAKESDQLVGTFVHEIAHGLLAYAISDYIAATGYWKDRSTTLSSSKRKESPVTEYGKVSAAEDLCESAMMFFVEPARLQKKCPKRYAFMTQLGKDWVPPPAVAPQVLPAAAAPTATPAPVPAAGPAATGFTGLFQRIGRLFSRSSTPKTPTGAAP